VDVPPVAAPAGDEEAADTETTAQPGERMEVWPPVRPLPEEEDASVYADGRLSMHVSVEPVHPRAGEPFDLVVTFRNDGTGPARFHVPEHTGLVPFPRLELRGADGKVRIPVAASFQSMWQLGLQGGVVRLEPGEESAIRTHVSGVAELEGDPSEHTTERFAYSQKRFDLPPGDYAVTAIHVKDKPTVPWGERNFGMSEKEVPGLWTGELRSTPISIRVAPPDEPMLIFRAPERLVPGEDLTVTLTVSNPSQEDREVRGAFAMRRSEKGGPSYVAWFAFGDRAVPTRPDHARTMTLAAGEERTCTIDVGSLVWERTDTRRSSFFRGPWPFYRAYPALWVTCGERDEDGEGMLGSNTAFRALEPAPDLAERGLSLRVESDGLSAAEPFVVVHLRNGGATDVTVPRELRTPERLRLSLERERKRPARIGVLDTAPAAELAPADLVTLAPGEEIHARVPVAKDWQDELPAGTYPLRAHWANADAGDRVGFAERPAVGRLQSEPVEIVVPAR
jgi:hypothetical protein